METNVLTGLHDTLESERGVMCILILIAATFLAAFGVITGSDWIALAKLLGVALVASKTVTGAVETVTTKGAAAMAKVSSSTPPKTPE